MVDDGGVLPLQHGGQELEARLLRAVPTGHRNRAGQGTASSRARHKEMFKGSETGGTTETVSTRTRRAGRQGPRPPSRSTAGAAANDLLEADGVEGVQVDAQDVPAAQRRGPRLTTSTAHRQNKEPASQRDTPEDSQTDSERSKPGVSTWSNSVWLPYGHYVEGGTW